MDSISNITIYLADDHRIVAEGISSIVAPLAFVDNVEIFENGQLLFNALNHKMASLVFLDLEMPIWDGRKTLSEIKSNYPDVKCIILSMLNEKSIIEDCINKGTDAYLNKDCSRDELQGAILAVLNGENYISKECMKTLANFKTANQNTSLILPELSDREMEVLKELCDGLTPKEIGDKLFLSPRTVETHKTNIMQKFEVKSIGKLISIALKNNIV